MAEDIVFGSIYVKEIGPHLSKALDVETDGRSAFPSTTRLTMRLNKSKLYFFGVWSSFLSDSGRSLVGLAFHQICVARQ